MKKGLISLGLAAVLCVSFTGCGKEEPAANYEKTIDQGTDALKKIGEKIKEKQEESKAEFEKSKVKVKDNVAFEHPKYGKIVLKSYGFDGDSIVLTFDYTNTSEFDSTASILTSLISAYQDGAKLNSAFTSYSEDANTSIKPGATVSAGKAYILRNNTSDIELEFETGEEKTSYTLKLK